MKKEIDLRKSEWCTESAVICSYLCRDYEQITTWNQLIPMTQMISDDFIGLHDGEEYCDADLIYEHNMHCVLYKDVSYVRNKVSKLVDYIKKEEAKLEVVDGHLYRLTVENLYEHKELRDALINEQIHHVSTHAYVWMEKGDGGQVWSFVDDEDKGGYVADFCNNYFQDPTPKGLIKKMYSESGWNVEPNIVFEA